MYLKGLSCVSKKTLNVSVALTLFWEVRVTELGTVHLYTIKSWISLLSVV